MASFTLTGGVYDDPAFVGMQGFLTLSSPMTNTATGEVFRKKWTVTVAADGTWSVTGLPFNDDPALTPTPTTYSMEWQALSWKPTPGNRTFQVLIGSGATTVDFDGLPTGVASTAPTAGAPFVVAVNGKTGTVNLTASDVGAASLVGGSVPDGQLPARLQDAALRTAFEPHPVNTIVYDGDSVTQIGGGIPANPFFNGRGFWCWAQSLTSHRLRSLGNVAIFGQTTTGILARIADTLALSPGWVHLLAGTNDIGQDVPAATTQANLAAYYDACDKAGIRVMAGTIPPNNGWTTPQQQAQAATNAWLRTQCRSRRNFVLVDYAAALTDPATGKYVTGYAQSDGTHPTQPGAQAMGRLLAQSILSLSPPAAMLMSDPTDTTNLINTVTAGAGRFSAGAWTQGGIAATLAKVARTDGIAGSWQRVVMPTGGDGYMQAPNVNSSGMRGQSVVGTVEYTISSLDPSPAANAQAFYLTLASYNGSSFNASIADLYWDASYENQGSSARSGVLRTPAFVVPNDSVVLQLVVHLTGGGTYDLDRASLTLA